MKLVKRLTQLIVSLALIASTFTTSVAAATTRQTYYTNDSGTDNYIYLNVTSSSQGTLRFNYSLDDLTIYQSKVALFNGSKSVDVSDEYCDSGNDGSCSMDLSSYSDGTYYVEFYYKTKSTGSWQSYISGYNGIPIIMDDGDITLSDTDAYAVSYAYNKDHVDSFPKSSGALGYYKTYSSSKLKNVVANIIGSSSDYYNNALKIHDWIGENIYIDTTASKYSSSNTNPYDVYTDEYASSLGFANLCVEMLRLAGIPAFVAKGQYVDSETQITSSIARGTTINHAWVYFYDEDSSRWVSMDPYLDTTNYYNGSKKVSGSVNHLYFDNELAFFSNSHIIREVEDYEDATVYVSSIVLGSSTIMLDENSTQYINATVYPTTAANKTLKYTSSDTSIVTVSSAGLLRPIAEGSATITIAATDGSGVSTKCTVTVGSSEVKSIRVSDTSLNLALWESAYLNIDLLPVTANDRTYTITSSNTSVARITNNRIVQGRAAGSATITITANDDSGIKTTIPVTVSSSKVSKSTVEFTDSSYEMVVGDTQTAALHYASKSGNSSISFTSLDTDVATVSSTGVITAKGTGTTRIKATLGDDSGAYDYVYVSVEEASTTTNGTYITLTDSTITMAAGDTKTIDLSVSPSSTSLSYTSLNTSVATVSSSGKVSAVAAGTASILISAADGSGAYATLTVKVTGSSTYVTSIVPGNTVAMVGLNDTYQIETEVLPSTAKNKELSYVSSNTSVASVDASGLVTGKSVGEANITILATDGTGVSTTVSVEVVKKSITYVESISVKESVLTMRMGTTYTIDETVEPSNATYDDVDYTSSNESVATVSSKGKISAKAIGTTTITLKTLDGSSAKKEIKLTVIGSSEQILVDSIATDVTSIELNVGDMKTITASVYPSTADINTVTFKSLNTKVASVSTTGSVYGVATGTTYITVSADDASGKSTNVKVTVGNPSESTTTTGTGPTNAQLADYSAFNMDVYANSRVTSIRSSGSNFVVEGYMFENGSSNANYNTARNWREIIFVSADNTASANAYRKQVTPIYNTWLNKNTTATQNGKYSLSYANYSVTVNPNAMYAYSDGKNTKAISMAKGNYYVYMRISNGTTTYLFPLVDKTLSDGTNMENKGTLPSGFTVYDSNTRALMYTVK